jgi:two-component system response regulator RegA
MSEASQSILLVDDDDAFRQRLAKALTARGLEVRSAANADEAITLAETESPELALVDLRMPGASGLEVVQALKEIDPTTRIVIFTGYGSIATALEAVKLGAYHYLTKPADVDEILAAFEREDPAERSTAESGVPALTQLEREHAERALEDFDGKISLIARRLGMARHALLRKNAPTDGDASPSLARVEWEHLERVMADCGGNLSEAARRLGIHRRSLQRKLARNRPVK